MGIFDRKRGKRQQNLEEYAWTRRPWYRGKKNILPWVLAGIIGAAALGGMYLAERAERKQYLSVQPAPQYSAQEVDPSLPFLPRGTDPPEVPKRFVGMKTPKLEELVEKSLPEPDRETSPKPLRQPVLPGLVYTGVVCGEPVGGVWHIGEPAPRFEFCGKGVPAYRDDRGGYIQEEYIRLSESNPLGDQGHVAFMDMPGHLGLRSGYPASVRTRPDATSMTLTPEMLDPGTLSDGELVVGLFRDEPQQERVASFRMPFTLSRAPVVEQYLGGKLLRSEPLHTCSTTE